MVVGRYPVLQIMAGVKSRPNVSRVQDAPFCLHRHYREFLKNKEVVMNIYVGNLSYGVTEEDLKEAFEAFGEVEIVKIIKDRYSGESKGFGFVEMPDGAGAEAAIDGLDGTELKGRTIKVNKARPRSEGHRGGARQGGGRRFY
jgi:RNA recognition motif-containing protein